MARLGNARTSAVISAARSGRAQQNAVNDQAAAYSYSNSPQTQQDYNAYEAYLKGRQATTTDPSQLITLDSKIRSAYTGYNSNEIQRQGDAVNTGEQSNTDKYNKILGLYHEAASKGYDAQAQNLASTLIGLSKTIQAEGIANDAKAQAAAKKQVSQTLSKNELQYHAMKEAHRTGVPVTLPDGTTRTLTSNDLALAEATYNASKESILTGAANSGLDNADQYKNDLMALTNSDSYAKAMNPKMLGMLTDKRFNSPVTNNVDTMGNSKIGLRTVDSIDPTTGTPLYKTGITGNFSSTGPADANFNRKTTTDATAPMDNYTVPSYQVKADDGTVDPLNRSLVDPVTGKPLTMLGAAPNTPEAKLVNDSIVNPGYALPAKMGGWTKEEIAQAGKPTKYDFLGGIGHAEEGLLHNVTNPHTALSSLSSALRPLSNPYNTVQNVLSSVAGGNRKRATDASAALAATQAREAAVARGTALLKTAKAPAPLPVYASQMPAQYNPASTTPVQNLLNSGTGATPAAKTFSGISNLLDTAIAANPKPAPAPQSSAQWWNPLSWGK